MKNLDIQIQKLQEKWKEDDYNKYIKPIIIEEKADNSKAQSILGGPMSISAPWYKPDQPELNKQLAWYNPDPKIGD